MTKVWFIRHGESEANAGAISNDPANIPLTKQGKQQAEHISTLFDNVPSLIVNSPFLRTQQTARPTIERFPNMSCAVWPIQEFTYLSPNKCQHTTAEQRRPTVMAYWERCDPNYVDGIGAESFSQMLGRVTDLIFVRHSKQPTKTPTKQTNK